MERLLAYFIVCLIMWAGASPALARDDNPCAEDIERFCANIPAGKGQIANCLKQNEAQLSPECKAQHLAEVAEALRQTDEVCKEDSVRFCGSYLQQSGFPLLNCLKLNAPSLSPECKTKLFDALELMHY